MEGFIRLVGTDEVPVGAMKEVESDGHPLLVANVNGAFHVSDGRCPHLGGHLPEGHLDGSIVTCPRHGSQFDLTDGHVVRWTHFTGVTLTMVELAKHPRPLRVYETAIEDGYLLVGPQKPPAAMPDAE